MKSMLKKLVVLMITTGVLLSFAGCGAKDMHLTAFDEFKNLFVSNDYEALYEMLTLESKERISKEDFVNRYSKIYDDINVKDIALDINGEVLVEKNIATFPVNFKMDTMAGPLEYPDYQVQLVKEEGDYYLNWDESLIIPSMVQGDKVRFRTLSAKRGNILDRHGIVLAGEGAVKWVGIHPRKFDDDKRNEKIANIAEILDINKEIIEKKLAQNTNPDHFVDIAKVVATDTERLDKVLNREAEGILVYDTNARVYSGGEATGRLLGYVAPITAEELENNPDKGYTSTSFIGKNGIEHVYEDTLRAIDGVELYIEKANGEEVTVAKKEPVNGKDVKLSIDLALQQQAYAQMEGREGATTAVDPKTGEVLALVHSPSYDSNMYTTYKTNSQIKKIEENPQAYANNKFKSLYSPGSTMKLITASIGLDHGVIVPEEVRDISGDKWQKDSSWGDYNVTRVNADVSGVNLKDAVKYSDNIYFAQVASELGNDKFIEGSKKFGIGEDIDFEYPLENTKITNTGKFSNDILLADSGYGQGEVMVTPLHVSMIYSALGNNGDIMQPILVLEDNKESKVWKEKAIDPVHLPVLQQAFLSPVNEEGGTANAGKIEGFSIAGKTGTAEIKQSQDDTEGTENGWFVAVDTDTSKISMSMILENTSSKDVVPRVKNAMESYLKANS